MQVKDKLKKIWQLLVKTGKGFIGDKIPKLSAALAYYTVFSLGPMLMMVIYISNILWRKEAIEGVLFGQINDLVGNKAALQIQEIIKNASITGNNVFTAIIGFVTLLIGATTVFTEIQDSINLIWKLEANKQQGWWLTVKHRLLSFSLVVGLAFLLLVSLLINGLIEGLMSRLETIFPRGTVVLFYLSNLIVTMLVTTTLFAIIFKVLPDAIIRWRDVAMGALLTAILFMLGRYGIAFYISNSHPGSAYGTAGSIIVILVWIYFSSFILYFGALFTKYYALTFGQEIRPNNYAVTVQTIQLKSNSKTLQENESANEKSNKQQ